MKRRFLALSTVIGLLFSVVVAAPSGAAITTPPANVVGTYDAPAAGDITVVWDAATSDNGPITYEVELLDASLAVVDSESLATSPVEFTGPGVGPFTARVVATDEDPASDEASSAAIATVPAAPVIGATTLVDADSASVAFTAPAANGGSAISGYTVTSSPDGLTGTGAASPIQVDGLAPDTAYTFTVTATNGVGTGAASAPTSPPTTTPDVPGAPTIGTASLVDDDSADVAFTAPADDGGSPITGYTVTVSPGGATVLGAASPIRVDGLAASTTYSFTVTATNAIDTGPASDSSNDITTPDPAQVPDAPTIGSAVLSDLDSASVTFSAPGDDGGSAITSYTVTSDPGNLTGTGGTSPVLVDGLQPGTAYTFTVTATNDVGTGAASGASNSVTTVDFPGAPTGVSAILVDKTSGRVSFTAPADDGGSALGDYTVTAVPDDGSLATITQTGPAGPIDLSGLSAGATYTVTVQASNVLGAGPASTSVELAVPRVPDLPVNVVASSETPFSSTITVSWGAPEDSGGAPVLSYVVTLAGQTVSVDASVTENKFTAIPVGTHVAEVHAVTVAGDGPVATAQEIEVRGFPPFNSEAGLIRQLYVDFLGREADSGGLAYWSGKQPTTDPTLPRSLAGSCSPRSSLHGEQSLGSTWPSLTVGLTLVAWTSGLIGSIAVRPTSTPSATALSGRTSSRRPTEA